MTATATPVTHVFVDPASQTTSAGTVSVDIRVAGAIDLGSYDFTLTWDAGVLSFVSATNGSFLGSAGRTVTCAAPATPATSVTFGCSTIGTEPGPDGDGVLTTIQFSTVADGTSALTLSSVALADTADSPLTVTTADGSITFVEPTPTGTPTSTPTGTSTPTPTVTPATAATMTVANIEIWEQSRGPWTDLYWRVTIEDGSGSPVESVLVNGVVWRVGAQWTISGITDSLGQLSGTLNGALSNTEYCTRVDDVSHGSFTYEAADSPFWDGSKVENCYTVVG